MYIRIRSTKHIHMHIRTYICTCLYIRTHDDDDDDDAVLMMVTMNKPMTTMMMMGAGLTVYVLRELGVQSKSENSQTS